MSVEEQLRQALADRANGLDGAAPDGRDLARRIHRAQRSAQRAQRAVLVAAMVVIAGSSGAVLGAFAVRPGGGTGTAQNSTNQTVDTDVPPATTPSTLPVTPTTGAPSATTTPSTSPSPGGGTGATGGGTGSTGATDNTSPGPVSGSPVHQATFDGLQVNWLTTQLASPVTVVSPGSDAACMPARVVTMSVGGQSPLAGGSAVLGLPGLQSAGIAVVASGAFGSVGRPGGWWAIIETGSAATTVAVQFPSGATVREPVTNGVAVLAVPAPVGSTDGAYSGYASAVADGATGVASSLEFIVGGAPASVDARAGVSAHGMSGGSCLPASAIEVAASGGSGPRSHVSGSGGGTAHPTTGPPSPVTDAGEVVAAFEQAYDLDPLLGLDWSFSAVDLSPTSGCSLSNLGSVGTAGNYKLVPPAVAIDAVAFVSPQRAVVIYQRGTGLRESGIAVLVDGSWKVGGATYCADMAPATSTTSP